MAKTSYSLSHTKWMCKYHIVFTPKYRRKAIYYKVRSDLIDIIKISMRLSWRGDYRRSYDARPCTPACTDTS